MEIRKTQQKCEILLNDIEKHELVNLNPHFHICNELISCWKKASSRLVNHNVTNLCSKLGTIVGASLGLVGSYKNSNVGIFVGCVTILSSLGVYLLERTRYSMFDQLIVDDLLQKAISKTEDLQQIKQPFTTQNSPPFNPQTMQ